MSQPRSLEELQQEYSDVLDLPPCGIECGEGWFRLLRIALEAFRTYCPDIKIMRIDGEVGVLRIEPARPLSRPAREIAEAIQGRSEEICQWCGSENYAGDCACTPAIRCGFLDGV